VNRETSYGRATVRQTCEAFRVSRQAYYAALKPRVVERARVRVERAGSWATAAELEAGIRRIVAEHPAWGVRKVWAVLRRDGMKVARKRVWAMMHRLGLVLPPLAERIEARLGGQVSVPESNRRWASDLTTVWTRQDGWVAIVPLVDCGDRSVLQWEVATSQESPVVLAPLARGLAETFGRPESVPDGLEFRSDHGPQFTGSDCRDLCQAWRVDHTFAPVGRPTGNAVAERLILTMKTELIWTRDWESTAELRTALAAWVVEYNERRPHQALEWRTPAEQRAINLGSPLEEAA
jgi:putative transposase